jgi:hypothetical protein
VELATTTTTSKQKVWCNRAKAFTAHGRHDGGALGVSIFLLGASW